MVRRYAPAMSGALRLQALDDNLEDYNNYEVDMLNVFENARLPLATSRRFADCGIRLGRTRNDER